MKTVLKLSVVAVFLMTGFAVFSAPLITGTMAPANEGAPADSASPRSLYVQNCARCHGSDGRAQTALGKKLEADDLTTSTASVSKITRIVTNGKGHMPGFKRRLTAAQISQIAGYVHGL